ncbi:hypothetical protein BH24DEI2_BH24DEI2_29210 [soil metagenome]
MNGVLEHHTPTEAARHRAAAAGLSLDDLKHSDPQRYKMLNAQPLLQVAPSLAAAASAVLFAAFRHYDLFELPGDDVTTLLVFPPLTPAETKRFDDALGRLAALDIHAQNYVYYRVVTDRQGEHRQLALPLAPAAWSGEANRLVGPFATQSAAEAWGEAHISGQGSLIHDTVPQAGAWFCDVFDAGA